MESLLPKNVRRFRSDLAVQEGKLDELGLIISLSGGNPRELRAVLNDIQQIQRSTEGLVAPLQESRDELQKIASRLEALKEEFVKRLDESPEPEIAAAINYFVRYVSGVKSSLSGERTTLDKELTPAKDFLETLGKTRDSLRKKIPEAWKTYYLTSSPELFSWKAWSEIEQRLQLWARSNGSMPQVPNPPPAAGADALEVERYQLLEEKRALSENYGDNIDRIKQVNNRLIEINIELDRRGIRP